MAQAPDGLSKLDPRSNEAGNELAGIHIRCLRLYEDFYRLAHVGSPQTELQDIVAQAKAIAANASHYSVSEVLAALRRKGTVQLILNQCKRALGTADQLIRLQFDWPYGHLVRADALLGLGHFAAAANAYQFAEQLMPARSPTDDFGHAEVVEQCQLLADCMAAISCQTLTAAHDCEITAMASWPLCSLRSRVVPLGRKMHSSARALQEQVNKTVSDALEVISRKGPRAVMSQHTFPSSAQQSGMEGQGAGAGDTWPQAPTNGAPAHAQEGTLDQYFSVLSRDARHGSVSAVPVQRAAVDTHAAAGARDNGAISAAPSPAQTVTADSAQPLGLLDTSMSSITDNPVLRTTLSDFDTKLAISTCAAGSSSRSPSPLRISEQDPEGSTLDNSPPQPGAAHRCGGAAVSAADARHARHARRELTRHGSGMLSSEAASTASLQWTSTTMTSGHHQFIATGDVAGNVNIWDASRLELAMELEGHCAAITAISFCKDLRKGSILLLATADVEGVVIVWILDVEGTCIGSHTLQAHANHVVAMHFVSGGRRLITTSKDTTVRIWSVATERLSVELEHKRPIMGMDCIEVNRKVAVATCTVNGVWAFWDIERRRCLLNGRRPAPCNHVRFTPPVHGLAEPRPMLVTCHWHKVHREASVHLWDVFGVELGRQIEPCHSFLGVSRGPIMDLAFAVDQSEKPLMALAAADGSLIIYDLFARSVLTHLTEAHLLGDGSPAGLNAVAYSEDGRLLLTCGADCSVKVWSVADMEVLLTFMGHQSPVVKLCRTGDPNVFATASEIGELAFWDLRLAQELASSAQANLGTC